MDTPETATVEVTQADRDAAAALIEDYWSGADASMMKLARSYRDGYSQGAFVRAFALHRTCATRQDGLREAAQELLDGLSSTYKARNGREVGIEADDGEKCYIVHSDFVTSLRAALSDSSTREESGADDALKEQEFNRGVLIAVSTLINCWGDGTQTEHLLAMINATPEMVEQMGFDNYDREPLLAVLNRSADDE